jgi:hypothetical protein
MTAPIPKTLETPPRTTGDAARDLPLLIDWFWRAYQVIQQSVAFINGQVSNPDFNPADLPDPANTTLAQAQQTANDAYNLANSASRRIDGFLAGTVTISDTDTGFAVTFTDPQEDDEYRVIVQAIANTGSPTADAFTVAEKVYTVNDFTVTMLGTPGGGNSITFEWQLIRNS